MMRLDSRIYIAGHEGLVGSAVLRLLAARGYRSLITCARAQLDLRNQDAVQNFFAKERPEYIFLAAAKVGGIGANAAYPAEFLYDNLMITANVIYAAHEYSVRKLLVLGSSCIYPRDASQPLREDALLTGSLEKTNEPYAIAKIAGLKLVEAYRHQYGSPFISCMPTNLYGPGDMFDRERSHVIPALITKICAAHDAGDPTVTLWGTGTPLREFLYVDDCADALIFLMEQYAENGWINVGSGEEVSIAVLAQMIADIVGYRGKIIFDATRPDGTPRKLLDVARINAHGWHARTGLQEGLERTIAWYLEKIHGISIHRLKNQAERQENHEAPRTEHTL